MEIVGQAPHPTPGPAALGVASWSRSSRCAAVPEGVWSFLLLREGPSA